jgi:hypothetical protein
MTAAQRMRRKRERRNATGFHAVAGMACANAETLAGDRRDHH